MNMLAGDSSRCMAKEPGDSRCGHVVSFTRGNTKMKSWDRRVQEVCRGK